MSASEEKKMPAKDSNPSRMGSVTVMIGRIPILDVEPVIDCGRRPVKAVTGESFEVLATVFREGHEMLGADVILHDPHGSAGPRIRMRELVPWTDRYGAEVTVTSVGAWQFHIEAWGDPFAHWYHDAGIKIPRGQDVELMLAEGALLFDRAMRRAREPMRAVLAAVSARLRDPAIPAADRLAAAADPEVTAIIDAHPLREHLTRSRKIPRRRAQGTGGLRRLVRVLPAVRRGEIRPDGPDGADLGNPSNGGAAARRHCRDGFRRGLPAADSPDRVHRKERP